MILRLRTPRNLTADLQESLSPSPNSQRLVAQEMTGHLEFAEH